MTKTIIFYILQIKKNIQILVIQYNLKFNKKYISICIIIKMKNLIKTRMAIFYNILNKIVVSYLWLDQVADVSLF